jgi:AcrR family transcriptional regulator
MREQIDDRTKRASTRRRILQTATHFYREIGHKKTTVLDIARSSSMSSANVYRFFSSRQAIEEPVVEELLEEVVHAATQAAHSSGPAIPRLIITLKAIAQLNEDRQAKDQKLHELVALAARQNWPIVLSYADRIRGLLRSIISAGHASGELHGDSPMSLTCCLLEAMDAYLSPWRISAAARQPSFDEMLHFCAGALRHSPSSQPIETTLNVLLRPSGNARDRGILVWRSAGRMR